MALSYALPTLTGGSESFLRFCSAIARPVNNAAAIQPTSTPGTEQCKAFGGVECRFAKHDKPKSKYVGVTWDSRIGKWTARVGKSSNRIYLGAFESEEEAAKERDLEVLRLLQEVRPGGGVSFMHAHDGNVSGTHAACTNTHVPSSIINCTYASLFCSAYL
jgi:hypothetical protein